MLVSLSWLRDLVKLNTSIEDAEIAERLTSAGLEVEAINDMRQSLHDVVVAKVSKVRAHPNADKLHLCDVQVGDETVPVVCGADNVVEGAYVALARPGAEIGGQKLAVVNLRGERSEGMLCSERELGIGDANDGILIIHDEVESGCPFTDILGEDQTIIEIDVTPNRPDALSHVGVARELAALTGGRLKVPTATLTERGGPVDDVASVRVEDAEACPRYSCRVIEGVKVAPSPAWVQRRLQRCGVRAINNVVDATNLILLERGQPLHAFDADRIVHERGRAGIVVRRAVAGETLQTLDGVERKLDSDDLVICDSDKAMALAGVMGGAGTEVNKATTTVLLESAYFSPSVVRRTARRHGLHTEASHRFERGCDPNRGVEDGLNRAAQLIAEFSGGTVRRGSIDVYPKKIQPKLVSLRPKRVASLLGLAPKFVDEAKLSALLGALGIEVANKDAEALHVRVPTWRPDLEREVDLIEEVVRLIGMDQIEESLPRGSGRKQRGVDRRLEQKVEADLRHVLRGAGFDEAVTLAFVSPKEDALFAPEKGQAVQIRNALGEDQSLLRRTLFIRLLASLRVNQRRGTDDVRLFEFGKVFLGPNPRGAEPRPQDADGPSGGDSYLIERQRLAALVTGRADPSGFDVEERNYDFFDFKGVVQDLIEALGYRADRLEDDALRFISVPALPGFHPRSSVVVRVGEIQVGILGELHPDVLQALALKGPVFGFEFDLQALESIARPVGRYSPLPRFPGMRRDLAMIIDDGISVDQILDSLRAKRDVHKGLLVNVDVFDVYRGDKVGPGKKSIALSCAYQSLERTLVEDEINSIHSALVDGLVKELRGELRQ